MRKYIFIAAFAVILCGSVYFYLLVNVITHQNNYSPNVSEYIVILGHSLDGGENPSNWLVGRMEEGLRLYDLGYADKIVVTGGKPDSYKVSVAESMQAWLLEHGVSAEDVLLEAYASNTYDNFRFTREIIGNASIIVVTNDFHMYRSMFIAKDYFSELSGSAAPVPIGFQKVLAYCKEPLSIIKYIFINRRTP